jgi:electron transfer flavoprotein alpha subunit
MSMEETMKAWIVATDAHIGELVQAADGCEQITLVAVGWNGGANAGCDRVIRIQGADEVPLEALAPAVVAHVAAQDDDCVIVESTQAGRVFAGALAIALHAPVLHSVQSVAERNVQLARYGGLVTETYATGGAVVLLVDGVSDGTNGTALIETVDATGYAARVTRYDAPVGGSVNLDQAKKIVGVGRGFKEQEDLHVAEELAQALGADIACSRPLAEGQNWLPRDRYIGVSGQKVSPDVYIAVGISGELQHMAGVRGAKTIVAINSDPKAPIMKQCDLGIVGDLYTVLPQLTAAIQQG